MSEKVSRYLIRDAVLKPSSFFRYIALGVLATTLSPVVALATEDRLMALDYIDACKTYRQEIEKNGDKQSRGKASVNAAICRAYLQGFLAGTNKVVKEERLPSEFMQRALRTKAHGGRERVEALTDGPYCLPEGETLDDIIEKLAETDDSFSTESSADQVISQVLESHYRCRD